VLAQSPPLDTVGAFARSVEDVALITDCTAGADSRDTDMGPRLKGSLLEALRDAPDRQPRLAFVKSPAWPQGEEAMQQAFAQFVTRLGPKRVEEVELPANFADTGGLQRAVQFRDIAKNYGPLADAHPGQISAKLAEVIAEGRSVTDHEYGHALARREPLYAALGPLLSRFDAILTPATAGPAPKGLGSTGSPAFNFLWTYLGMPAISLPLLEAGGLPVGVQLVGRRDEDGRLLAAARDMMRA
jgi:Asp-tRNA(Asn)/Glu-tRNA(Gln) amidotransferase A subunit family amidase